MKIEKNLKKMGEIWPKFENMKIIANVANIRWKLVKIAKNWSKIWKISLKINENHEKFWKMGENDCCMKISAVAHKWPSIF